MWTFYRKTLAMATMFPNTDDVELIRAHAEATRKVGNPGYAHAARHSPADSDGERNIWREARYMKPLHALTHGPVDAKGNATGLDHDVLMRVMASLPGRAPYHDPGLPKDAQSQLGTGMPFDLTEQSGTGIYSYE